MGQSSRDQQKAGVAGLYAVFAILSVMAVAFIYFFVRETMGKSLEELEVDGGGEGGGRTGMAYHRRGSVKDGEYEEGGSLLESQHGGDEGSVMGDGEDACRVML